VKYSGIADLPKGAKVGTSSLRRQAQLKQQRPDLEIFPLRGNVDTRVRKLEEGEYDAIVLAAAGLNRLGKTQFVKQVLDADVMCPAAGQGALGIEIRGGDSIMREHVKFLDSEASRAATSCERALLNQLGGGCQVPIGAFAEMKEGKLTLTAICAKPDGTKVLREVQTGTDPQELGERTGMLLLHNGGDEILKEVYGSAAAAPQQP
jgi:hydroxymethylbilane synthase